MFAMHNMPVATTFAKHDWTREYIPVKGNHGNNEIKTDCKKMNLYNRFNTDRVVCSAE